MKYIALFVLIQLVNIPLMLAGWILCAFPEPPWFWQNDDDMQLIGTMSYWRRYVYTAWRNPVANLRHVPGVSKVGRPLYYRTWLVKLPFGSDKGKQFYFKAGWMSDGYPALSAGSGKGF